MHAIIQISNHKEISVFTADIIYCSIAFHNGYIQKKKIIIIIIIKKIDTSVCHSIRSYPMLIT